ncbi:MAG: putative viral replication protein [Cressdnaviricota sp.]|nr:MAG: putative viral replication protein [Cressdnaviricota sp.]
MMNAVNNSLDVTTLAAVVGEVDVMDVGGIGNTDTPSENNPPKKKRCPLRVHHFFTYNNYSQDILDVMDATFRHFCYQFVFQEEIGEEGTPHLQGVISCKKQTRWTEFQLPSQIHWEATKNVGASYAYCSKTETRNGKMYCLNFTPKVELKLITPDRGYQKFILDIINKEPCERSIYWFWESIGNVGKSSFCKYLVAKKKALYIDEGKKSDIINLIYKADMDLHDLIVVDIPRANMNKCSYKTLESLKNGVICNTKYETGTKLFNSPHIIVFCNFPPEPVGLSEDRLKVFQIDEEYELIGEQD